MNVLQFIFKAWRKSGLQFEKGQEILKKWKKKVVFCFYFYHNQAINLNIIKKFGFNSWLDSLNLSCFAPNVGA